MDIKSLISSIYKLSEKATSELLDCTERIELPKGHILSEAGRIDHYLYFLEKGIVRAYALHEGVEVTFWFGVEGSVVCSMRNFIEKKPSYETVELLEDCTFYRMRTSDLERLSSENLEIANWVISFMGKEVIRAENRLIELQFSSATERYQTLLEHNPDLLQRVPLGIIACYLGITQVSLSRIRAKGV